MLTNETWLKSRISEFKQDVAPGDHVSLSYLDTSCTGMFLFTITTGVRMGWLPESE